VNQLTGDRAGIAATFGSLWSRHARSLLLAVVALAAGLGVGRFLTYSDDATPTAAPAVALSPADRIASLEQTVTARPDDPLAWQGLGVAYVQQAIATGDPTFYDLADRALDRATELDPDAGATKVARGTLALTLHEFGDALALGESVIAAEPTNRGALAVIVDAQVELGRYDEAAATLQTLLDLRPDLPALARTSYLRQLTGDLDGALAAIRQARTAGAGLTVELAGVTTIEGDVQLLRGDPDAALAAYDDALRTVPDLTLAVVGRARALAAAGDADTAIGELAALVDRRPTPEGAVLLGELHALEGDDTAAAEAFALARTMYDLQAAAGQVVDLEAALFEADHGDPVAAVELARAAYAERRTVFTADALAWSLHRAGRSDEALPFAEESVARGAPEASIRLHSAAVLAAAGRAADAATVLTVATDTGGWLAPSLRPIATDLAASLGLDRPAAWR
jgi:tetratricopeptide (TPR) repeat protein